MSLENINTERIIKARALREDHTSDGVNKLEYPIPPAFGQIAPRIRFVLGFQELDP